MAPPRSAAAAAAAAAAIARASGVAASSSASIATVSSPAVSATISAASVARSSREHVVRLLTFNIWFDPLCMATRMRAIGSIVEKHRPAIIGFQEVTRESLVMLRRQRWSQYYDCSIDTAPPFSEAYFVVLFSALPVLSLESLPFANTGMGRELLAINVEVAPGHTLLVGTSHLESLPQFNKVRVSQLKQSFQFLSDRVTEQTGSSKSLGAVLMGDMNLLRGDMKLMDPRCAAEEITVEVSTTGRAKCRKCGEMITKDTIRVGKSAKDTLPNGRVVEIKMWFHQDCFLAHSAMSELDKQAVYQSPLYKSATQALEKSFETRGEKSGGGDGCIGAGGEPVNPASLGLPPRWNDLWLSVAGNTESNGFTYDGKRNGVIKNKSYQSRFDRVYLFPGERVDMERAFETIEMVGTAPIADGLWASDHFGLLTTLCFDPFINEAKADAKRKRDDEGVDDHDHDHDRHEELHSKSKGSKNAPIELD